jgi:hypothetical protein
MLTDPIKMVRRYYYKGRLEGPNRHNCSLLWYAILSVVMILITNTGFSIFIAIFTSKIDMYLMYNA